MLQTFTYSTGAALTGSSAACAPATATRPAAEPRRRLFTIFIVTSKFVNRGRVPSLPSAAAPWKVPLKVPAQPPGFPCPTSSNQSLGAIREPGRGDLGNAPLRRNFTLTYG